ncbi:MAG TPA: PHP domain-containing protein [Bryobacteraceae bacterium]|nr:PHP domain-containing protein [Bryobacteraceae bacterium]
MLSNAEIADRLTSLAQILSLEKENKFKVKAYRRAAKTIRTLSESVDELVRDDADLTIYAGIGSAISSAIREIVLTGALKKLETLRTEAPPEVAAINQFPRLDPRRVLRIYKKLNISSVPELKEKLESGAIAEKLGSRMAYHVQQALAEAEAILLPEAQLIAGEIAKYLMNKCGVLRAEVAGEYRRRVEVIRELSFLIETDNFSGVISKLEKYGGRTPLLSSDATSAVFRLSSGILLRVCIAKQENWGSELILATGSEAHLLKLRPSGDYPTEAAAYKKAGLAFIPPELREGNDELELAASGHLPVLVSVQDIRGELHAHSTSSDGANTIEAMAMAAKDKGYEYLGITDHSQSLTIARGVSERDLWAQIRAIDQINGTLSGIRILKSAEVDILVDGSLDYPDSLLSELDYTVCSIHSRFNHGKAAQTERIMRAMDNRYFNILGHATGRMLLKRGGYEIDIERIVEHARKNGCFFEINSNPNRLDVSAEYARIVREAGVMIAITTDAHSIREMEFLQYGVDQARRAGITRQSVLNCLSRAEFQKTIRR